MLSISAQKCLLPQNFTEKLTVLTPSPDWLHLTQCLLQDAFSVYDMRGCIRGQAGQKRGLVPNASPVRQSWLDLVPISGPLPFTWLLSLPQSLPIGAWRSWEGMLAMGNGGCEDGLYQGIYVTTTTRSCCPRAMSSQLPW